MTDQHEDGGQAEDDPLGLFSESGGNLTMKQRLFAQTYVDNGGNGTQAAITAGYKEDHAAEMAHENLRKPHILDEVKRCYQLRVAASGATADYALSKLKDNLEAASDAQRFSDVNKAVELIGKYHKLFTDKFEHSGQIDSTLEVAGDILYKK